MTCEAGKTGRDVPLGASRPAASTPRLESIHHAAKAALTEFAAEQRLVGSVMAHESFDGILAEHVLALEEVRRELCIGIDAMRSFDVPRKERIRHALELLDEQVKYVRALGSVAEPPSKKEES